MLLLVILSSVFGNECLKALEYEGKSILQLLVGDHNNIQDKSLAAQQFMFSGKDINDMGHWSSCIKLENTTYQIVQIKTSGILLNIGLCLPEKCSSSELSNLLNSKPLLSTFPSTHLNSLLGKSSISIEAFEPVTYPLGVGGVITLIICFMILAIVVYATYIDIKSQKKQVAKEVSVELSEKGERPQMELLAPPKRPSKYAMLLLNFSFIRNWNSLFTRRVEDTTVIFDGVRAMTVGWVVLGHVYLTRMLDIVYNIEDIPYVMQSNLAVLGLSSAISVDTFFWMGGFLFGYLSLQHVSKTKKAIPWGLGILTRILRLLPLYIFAMCFVNLIAPSLGHGPLWHLTGEYLTVDCDDYWWSNFLFINNLVPDGKGNDCIGQSWYLACDFQIFFFAILMFSMYMKAPRHYTWVLVVLLSIAACILSTSIAYDNEITYSMFNSKQSVDKYRKIYTKPYTRFPPYLLGMMCGFVYCQKTTGKFMDFCAKVIDKVLNSKVKAYAVFAVGLGLLAIVVWVPSYCFQDIEGDFMYYSRSGNAFIVGTFNTLTGLSFCCLFMPMLYGMIPIPQAILSWSGWIPIAKASYSIYLIHLVIMRICLASEDYGFNMTQFNLFLDFVFNVTLEFPIGIIVYLIFEAPAAGVIKAMMMAKKGQNVRQEPLLSAELKDTELKDTELKSTG